MKMKKSSIYYLFFIALFQFLFFSQVFCSAKGYEIKVHIIGLQDSTIYLGNHYGEKQYVKDTLKLDHDGWATFKGNDSLPGGIYLIVLPGKTYFEILVNEQKFTIETDTLDYVMHMKVTGSVENKLFNDHQRYIINMSKNTQALKARMDANKDNPDSTAEMKKKIMDMDKEVKDYRLKILNDYPQSFMSKIIHTMQEPEVPDPPKDDKGNITDSSFQFRYYKSHYLQNVDFSDDRLLRTPIFQSKIKTYTQQLTVPVPDSIIPSVDTIIDKSKANKEVFKYCVATLANYYETSNIMGYDKVFVHIAEKYYLSNDAYWVDSTLKAKIQERVEKIKPNILGQPAHDLIMPDTGLVMHSLYGVKAKYTILAFWDPTCSHCKHEIPKLCQYYDSVKTKGVSLEVFSVGIESDIDLWKKFIIENKLDWINVSDLYNQTNFRNYYDIYSTPVIYLLDEQKHIIAKRLDTDKIKDFIEHSEKTK
jgi:thiol-disulfide isomerase/thioredoxin